MAERKTNSNKKTLSFEINERGEKGGGSPLPIGKSRASSFEKVERNKRGC
jgi:hypothetical protein